MKSSRKRSFNQVFTQTNLWEYGFERKRFKDGVLDSVWLENKFPKKVEIKKEKKIKKIAKQ